MKELYLQPGIKVKVQPLCSPSRDFIDKSLNMMRCMGNGLETCFKMSDMNSFMSEGRVEKWPYTVSSSSFSHCSEKLSYKKKY